MFTTCYKQLLKYSVGTQTNGHESTVNKLSLEIRGRFITTGAVWFQDSLPVSVVCVWANDFAYFQMKVVIPSGIIKYNCFRQKDIGF